MTGRDLFQEIGNIREEFVAEAENYQSEKKGSFLTVISRKTAKSSTFRKTLATAACLVVCAGLVFTVQKRGISKDMAKESAMENEMVMESASGDLMNFVQQGMEDVCEEEIAIFPETEGGIVTDADSDNVTEIPSKTNGIKDEVKKETAEEDKLESVFGESQFAMNSELKAWDLKEVKKRMKSYPDEYDKILQLDNVFVLVHGTVEKGQNLWDSFLAAVDAGKGAQIDVIRFTVEGDPIIETVHYDGEVFYLCVDNSRDAYRGKGDKYFDAKYSQLVKEETVLDAGGRTIEYFLTEGENKYSIVYISE